MTAPAVAAGLIWGRAGLQEFSEEAVRGETVLALTRREQVEADEALSAAFPGIQAAIVEVKTFDGRTLTQRVDYPKGEPENPLSEAEFRSRFDQLTAYAGKSAADAEALYGFVQTGGSVSGMPGIE